MSSELKLIEFLEEYIASKSEFLRYQAVKHLEIKQDIYTIFNFEKVLANSSPETRAKYALEKNFEKRIRQTILGGGWIVTARWINGGPFKTLHRREWEKGKIDICSNFLGSTFAGRPHNGYTDIAIAPDDNVVSKWRSQENQPKINQAIKQWFKDYADKGGVQITCSCAYDLCVADLSPSIPINSIALSRFKKLFRENFPSNLKYRGAPKKQ